MEACSKIEKLDLVPGKRYQISTLPKNYNGEFKRTDVDGFLVFEGIYENEDDNSEYGFYPDEIEVVKPIEDKVIELYRQWKSNALSFEIPPAELAYAVWSHSGAKLDNTGARRIGFVDGGHAVILYADSETECRVSRCPLI